MRAIQTCDFCERTATGTFEVVPQPLEPTEAEQRRVVLCEACQTRLESLLEPLFDRLLDGNRTEGEESDATTDASHRERTATEGITLGAPTSSVETNADTHAPDDPAEATAETTNVEPADQSDDSSAGGEGDAEDDSVDADETVSAGSVAGDSSDGTDSSEPATTDDRNRPPAAYGKVLRLLSNREFPMARSDVEGLAAGAYELEGHEVEAIIDHAIETGEFVEDGSQLRRT
ncbi:hypothetical protein [Natronosalvus vescus]|uniref:hypothetical protein n=1 Tax=Natronosalvus vescus TaxID=2953881 RepID=UPI0020900F48|nr:hypothetical protein [Natronosalvus vescus]